MTSGRLDLTALALAPMHHGGGTDGNRQILRKQRFVHPDTGKLCRVPFISGNSFKHLIRSHAARFALDAMGVEDGALTKGQIHLLFSGGALSGGGSTVKLARVRELERLFPLLSLCGYSAGNHMAGSKLRVSHWHLVCAQNVWRMPAALRDHPHAKLRSGALIADEFGTRHEPTRADPRARALLTSGETQAGVDRLEAAIAAKGKKKAPPKDTDSAQMIYSFEVVMAGTTWWGSVYYEDLSPMELAALKSGLGYACQGLDAEGRMLMTRAAKGAVGFGAMAVAATGSVREIDTPRYLPSDEALPTPARDETPSELGAYAAHLAEHRDSILAALKETSK